jgi:hypothetical protein
VTDPLVGAVLDDTLTVEVPHGKSFP